MDKVWLLNQTLAAALATQMIDAMGLDPSDFLEDFTTDEFKEKAAKALEQQTQEQQKTKALNDRKMEAEACSCGS